MQNKKKALIFGITGQDGSYLSSILLKKGYAIYGVRRKINNKNLNKLNILNKIKFITIKNNNYKKLNFILNKNFDEIYFLGGQSSVVNSFKNEDDTYYSQIDPIKYILEYIKNQKLEKSKFLYAGSSEIFGNQKKKKLNENSLKSPQSPYGLSKLISFEIIKSYREMFKIPVCTAILFNHESSLRNNNYVLKKISLRIKNINNEKKSKILLGNINIKRDWGWAPEYMEACYKILNSVKIDDYIIATGQTVSLKKIIKIIFKEKTLDWKKFIKISNKIKRKYEIYENYADIRKIKKNINWRPASNYLKVIHNLIKNEI
jgi:GDPmannose 4,6-dehydratase